MTLVPRYSFAKKAIPIFMLPEALPLPRTYARAPHAFKMEQELVVVAAQCEFVYAGLKLNRQLMANLINLSLMDASGDEARP
jgi:hypothetical protein